MLTTSAPRVSNLLIILNLPHYSLVTVGPHFLNDWCRSFLNLHRICYVEYVYLEIHRIRNLFPNFPSFSSLLQLKVLK